MFDKIKQKSNKIMPSTTYIILPESTSIIEGCFLDSIKSHKYSALYNMLNNPFYSDTIKSDLANLFYLIQKYNNALKKLIYQWKRRHINKYTNNTDLRLNNLSTYNTTQIISIIENNTIYDFCLPDLIKIIHNALLYHENLFPKPSLPKNPYTNLPLGIHNLYNIYFHILESSQIMPYIFYLFFLSNFDIYRFHIYNETILREESMKLYYNDKTVEEQYNDILSMLNKYAKCIPNIIIHVKFSKQEIINKLGGLLPDYLITQFSYYPTKRILSSNKIKKFLKKFNKESPKFGRMIYKNITAPGKFTIVMP